MRADPESRTLDHSDPPPVVPTPCPIGHLIHRWTPCRPAPPAQDVPGNPLQGLQHADAAWAEYQALDPLHPKPPPMLFRDCTPAPAPPAAPEDTCSPARPPFPHPRRTDPCPFPGRFDVVVLGGTLGLLPAACLARKGYRVAVVERGALSGRAQEWNCRMKDLQVLEEAGVVPAGALEALIATRYETLDL